MSFRAATCVAYSALIAFGAMAFSSLEAQVFLPNNPPVLPPLPSSGSSFSQSSSIVNNEPIETLSKKQYQPKSKTKAKSETDSSASYDPSRPDLSKAYSFADKSYQPAFTSQDQRALLKMPAYKGKPFINDTTPVNFGRYSGTDSQSSLYHDKTFPASTAYPTTDSDAAKKKSTAYSKSFAVPAKAVYGDETAYPTNEALAYNHKTYDGPEAQVAKQEMNRVSRGLSGLKEIPSRPLSIDEVKNLLNKGHSPSQDSPSNDSEELRRPSVHSSDSSSEDAPPVENRADETHTTDPQMPGPGEMATPGSSSTKGSQLLPPQENFQAVDPAAGSPGTAEPLPQ